MFDLQPQLREIAKFPRNDPFAGVVNGKDREYSQWPKWLSI
jgi:hypothetical protein